MADDTIHYDTNPELIYLYLPNGEVHLVKGATSVSFDRVSRVLSFVDRRGVFCVTSNTFTLAFGDTTSTSTNSGESHEQQSA